MKNVGYIISGKGVVTLILNGKSFTVETDHKNYDKIIKALKSKAFGSLERLIDIGGSIAKFTKGVAKVVDGEITFNGVVVDNSLTKRIITLMNGGLPFEPMIKFFENLMLNPSQRSINELYNFLDCNNLPITEDGHFLAYKRVNDNFTDMHSGTIDNSVGQKPRMERTKVDDDKDALCSTGLHFCSFEYLAHFNAGRGKIMVLKINPKDVVSIPADYDNSKGRCAGYEVIAVSDREESDNFLKDGLYNSKGEVVTISPFDLGAQGWKDGLWPDDNPFDIDTVSYQAWFEGYNSAEEWLNGLLEQEQAELSFFQRPDVASDVVVTTYHNLRDAKGRFKPKAKLKRDDKGRFI